jgi:hypothetical protein
MASTTQIIPKYSFPHVETYVNDYTQIANVDLNDNTVDNAVVEAYAVTCQKGIDNTWVRITTKANAVNTFGDSNFKLYGQPYMQALHVLDQDNAEVWLMRVMPTNATYSNVIVDAYYKADTASDAADASARKFRVKLKPYYTDTDITTSESFKEAIADHIKKAATKDASGYTGATLFGARYVGRGTCGNDYSLRIAQNVNYEKNYGITMYNFEVMDKYSELSKDATYVAALQSSVKYGAVTATLVDDIIADSSITSTPIIIKTNESSIEDVYNAYVAFIKQQNTDLQTEYTKKLASYKIPEDVMNGTVAASGDEMITHYNELVKISDLIEATDEDKIPELDQFDIILGNKVGVSTKLPFYTLVQQDADLAASNNDYTSDEIINFSSTTGVSLKNGKNGYFDTPRTEVKDSKTIQWTYEDEVNQCYIDAFEGNLDRKILSPRRMNVTAFFDANYDYKVKMSLVKLAEARNHCRVYLDTGFTDSLSLEKLSSLSRDYADVINSHTVSVDLHDFYVKEYTTNKSRHVTISYLTSYIFPDHYTNVGYYIPMVYSYATLSTTPGNENNIIRNSMTPVIEEYDVEYKEKLNNMHINYWECIDEDTFQRATQNTMQTSPTDLSEENNSLILYALKRNVEDDARSQLYNFTDSNIRSTFIAAEKAKFSTWVGRQLESFDITFSVSQYEFENAILHCYLAVVFRGLTKKVIIEIDLNKREYVPTTTDTGETVAVSQS